MTCVNPATLGHPGYARRSGSSPRSSVTRATREVIDMARTARGARSDAPAWIEPMLAKSDGGRLPTGSAITYEYKLWPDFACCPLSA